jgi:sporulation protein YlmC with PRC-barrel domain
MDAVAGVARAGFMGPSPKCHRGDLASELMTNYIYDAGGNAIGFRRGRYIYDMRGRAIGQLNDRHVHKLSGQYVGELYDDMVVDKHLGNLGNIGNPGNPGNPGSPGNPGNRGAHGTSYRDVFATLTE